MAVNVAALNPSLVESELFGHVRGAFTGAEQSHRGLLEQSSGGTIFFDEVADIPLGLQVKLLRAVEQGEILPVGGNADRHRSASRLGDPSDLHDKVNDGSFRHDLYFRLTTFQIDIPPLRDRRDDIRPLVGALPGGIGDSSTRAPLPFRTDAVGGIGTPAWPWKCPRVEERHRARNDHGPQRDDRRGASASNGVDGPFGAR